MVAKGADTFWEVYVPGNDRLSPYDNHLINSYCHAVVLVVFGETKRREIGEAVDMVDIALQIALHLEGGTPGLKGEHRLPIKPEIALPEMVVEDLVDPHILEIFFGSKEEFGQLFLRSGIQGEIVAGLRILAAVKGRPA